MPPAGRAPAEARAGVSGGGGGEEEEGGTTLSGRRRVLCGALRGCAPSCGAGHAASAALDRLRFDLAAYWVHPMAGALQAKHVEALLHTGSVLLKGAFPLPMVRQAGVEARGRSRSSERPPHLWAHERAFGSSARPMMLRHAPAPEGRARPPAPELFADEYGVTPEKHPALCGAMRGLRGLAAALEVSELRLATPRGAVLREVLEGGVQAHGPLNSGWPDTGHEVECTLIVHRAGATEAEEGTSAATVSVTSHGKRRKHTPQPGDILLTLARQARST